MIEVALGEFNIPKWSFHKCSGVDFLSKEVSYIRAFIENNKNAEWAVKYHIDKGPLQELKKSQDRSGYIIYQADQRIHVS